MLTNIRPRNAWAITPIIALIFAAPAAFGAEATIHGTFGKIDSTTKTVGMKLADGTAHAARYTAYGTTVVATVMAKDTIQGVKRDSEALAHGGKTLAVKSADGTEYAFKGADHAAVDGAKGVEKSSRASAYYVADGSKRVAHFFENL